MSLTLNITLNSQNLPKVIIPWYKEITARKEPSIEGHQMEKQAWIYMV